MAESATETMTIGICAFVEVSKPSFGFQHLDGQTNKVVFFFFRPKLPSMLFRKF
jgi:hypothetical protein